MARRVRTFTVACTTILAAVVVGADVGVRLRPEPDGLVTAKSRPHPQRVLQPTRTIGGEDIFGRIGDIAVAGSSLIVVDQAPLLDDRQVLLVDLETGRVEARTGKVGEGPGEFLFPTSIDVTDGGRLWIYDFQRGRIASYDLNPWTGEHRTIISVDPGLFQLRWLDGETLVANGLFPVELLRFYKVAHRQAVRSSSAGDSPFLHADPHVRVHLNRTALALDAARKRVVIAFLYISRLHFFDNTGALLRAVDGPIEIELRYRVVRDPQEGINRFLRTADTRFAYVDVAASSRHVYALFSGRSRGDFGNRAHLADQLHVFTWDGKLVGIWTFQDELSGIAYDHQHDRLYGVRDDPFPAILEFGPIGGNAVASRPEARLPRT